MDNNVPFSETKTYDKPFDPEGKSKDFACRIIKAYQYLTERAPKKDYNLSKLLLVKGTQIGDFVLQKDYQAAYLAASSTLYWIEMEMKGEYLGEEEGQSLHEDCERLVRYLYVLAHPESRKKEKEA